MAQPRNDHRVLDRPRPGLVLVIVLVVIAMMTLAGYTFSELMLSERKAARLMNRQAQARALAESGVEAARHLVAQTEDMQIEAGGVFDNQSRFRGVMIVPGDVPADCGRFTLIAPAQENGIFSGIRYGLENESTKLNLNTLIQLEKTTAGSGRQLLMALPGMTEDIADSILDWMDTDDESREFGAERDYYSALEKPYAPRNGALTTLEELMLVKGVTPALLFGPDGNRNGVVDANESADAAMGEADNSDGGMNRGWAAYLTLYSAESNLRSDGTARIYVNQSNMQTLYTALEQALGQEQATYIVAYRQKGPYQATAATGSVNTANSQAAVPGPPTGQLDLTQAGTFPLTTVLDLVGGQVQVTFTGQTNPSTLNSPFSADPGNMQGYMAKLMDTLSVNQQQSIPGRINVNQAPRLVLEGIPGMTAEMVEGILSQRQMDPLNDSPDHKYETWLLTTGVCTLAEMKSLMPFVTTGGSVYRAQSVGYFDNGGPAARIEAIIDATQHPPRVVFWREITHLGRGYPLSVLGADDAAP